MSLDASEIFSDKDLLQYVVIRFELEKVLKAASRSKREFDGYKGVVDIEAHGNMTH